MHTIHVIGKIILSSYQREWLVRLGAKYIADTNPEKTTKDELIRRIGDASIVLNNISTPLNADVLHSCPNIKFIQTWSTGVDNVDTNYAMKNGIRVANVPSFSTEAVAERTIGMLILAASNVIDANKDVTKGGWDYQGFTGSELKDKTLLLVGFGEIAKRVYELAQVFGMKISYTTSETSRNI